MPAVDGNVQRVYARVFAIHANPAAKQTVDHLYRLATSLVPKARPGDYNQALMDLGNMICKPKNPTCASCPLSEHCIAYTQSRLSHKEAAQKIDIEDSPSKSSPCTLCDPFEEEELESREVTRYPMQKIKKKAREEETAVCILEWRPSQSTGTKDSKFLLLKRPEQGVPLSEKTSIFLTCRAGLLAGMHEFPSVDLEKCETTEGERKKALCKLLTKSLSLSKPFKFDLGDSANGLTVKAIRDCSTLRHRFSHIVRDYMPINCLIESSQLPKLSAGSWFAASQIGTANIPTAVKNIWLDFSGDKPAKTSPQKRARPSEGKVSSIKRIKTAVVVTAVDPEVLAELSEAEEEVSVVKRKKRVIAIDEDDE